LNLIDFLLSQLERLGKAARRDDFPVGAVLLLSRFEANLQLDRSISLQVEIESCAAVIERRWLVAEDDLRRAFDPVETEIAKLRGGLVDQRRLRLSPLAGHDSAHLEHVGKIRGKRELDSNLHRRRRKIPDRNSLKETPAGQNPTALDLDQIARQNDRMIASEEIRIRQIDA